MNRKKIAQLLIVTSASCACLATLNKEVSAEPLHNKDAKNSKSIEQSSITKGQVVNVSSNLRIRNDANINSSIVGYLVNGDNFIIKSIKNDWYEIEKDNKKGYIFKDYVKRLDSNNIPSSSSNNINNTIINKTNNSNINATANKETAKNSTGQVVNISSNLRIRQTANINSSIVGSLNNGETLTIKGISGDWYQIEKGSKKGYVFKDYVKELSSNNTPSTPNTTNNTSSTPNTNTEKSTPLNGQVTNVSSSLRVRQSANVSSSVLGYLTNGCNVSIKEKVGDWYKISFNNSFGYINSNYVKIVENSSSQNNNSTNNNSNNGSTNTNTNTNNNNNNTNTSDIKNTEKQTGIVYNLSTNLRLRTAANTSSTTLAYILPNEKVTILSDNGDWYKVNYKDKTGYASKQYIKKYTGSDTSNSNNSNSNNSNSTVSKNYESLLNVMRSQLGSPYIFGGAGEALTPDLIARLKKAFPSEAARGIYNVSSNAFNNQYKAFDCSGLMQWSFRQIGINIGRTTWDQINNGSEVSLNNLKPGDLLFYSNLNHVGMYIGNGQWIEAPNSRSTVRIAAVPWNKVSKARRILN